MADKQFEQSNYNEIFGAMGLQVPGASKPGSESTRTVRAESGTGTPSNEYDMGIKGAADFSEYRTGMIKDAFKNQPTLWEAIGRHRDNQMTALENNSAIYLLAYIDTHDQNALNMFSENESKLAVEREKKVSEDWARDTLRNPGASDVAKQMARGIAAKIFKPYGLETDMAQFAQFQAGLSAAKLSTAQGYSYMKGDSEAAAAMMSLQMKHDEAIEQYRLNVLAAVQGKKVDPATAAMFKSWWPEYGVENGDEALMKQANKQNGVS